ncbi:methyltransferase domain-containing protein [Streptomyces sp. 3MP-14]|uniref:Methyltransferase domain-containing protein n=1 Tax=Streptomyces mimosae TaxID=2586635 RepID=A0A5N6A3Q9_9ACTN|nr:MULTISPECIES: class I SAM-dependent methyltransferase [Streptomyces]KAB8162633.1 methyltransferase domain-containing protein [Streptomyces mimosae]KAB8174460.1 methyltransferase domain-containing protein [Streptomyces sp. 3MP-14]
MSGRTREGCIGTGPGPITPDGCAVERWLRLPVGREPNIIERAVPAGASILELGCGVGRVTHPLVERGFTVTAVDESPEMLEHVRGARTVCAAIEELDLGDETFDVVLLMSFLIHNADPGVRAGMLRACRRYVADGGVVLIQREGEDWHQRVPREAKTGDDGLIRVASAEPINDELIRIRVEYEFPDAEWTHTFSSYRWGREAFEEALAGAGLPVERYLTLDRTWVLARPA